MKHFFIALTLVMAVCTSQVMAQEEAAERPTTLADYKEKPYNEEIDAMVQIDEAIVKASAEGKKIICQLGGNWCIWCLRFADFITKDEEINTLVTDNFVYLHINNSPKNRNEKAMERLGNPKFGYPTLILLNEKGKILTVQESGCLEKNKSYDREKVLALFGCWSKL